MSSRVTIAERRANGECRECGAPANGAVRCPEHAAVHAAKMKRYYDEVQQGLRAAPACQLVNECARCGKPCRGRYCGIVCRGEAQTERNAAARAEGKPVRNPHRSYHLGVSNRVYASKLNCPCSKCKAARAEDPAMHAAFVARIAAEMGKPVATGPARPMVKDREDWAAYFEKIHADRKAWKRGFQVWRD